MILVIRGWAIFLDKIVIGTSNNEELPFWEISFKSKKYESFGKFL